MGFGSLEKSSESSSSIAIVPENLFDGIDAASLAKTNLAGSKERTY